MHQQKSDFLSACINMFKGLIGIGVLSLPIAFSRSGYLTGLFLLTFCGQLMIYVSKKMMEIADKQLFQAQNITQFCIQTLGKKSELLINICLFGMQLSVCVAYVIYFTSYFQEIFCILIVNRQNYICQSRLIPLLFSLVLIFPLIFIKEISKLQQWSLMANILVFFSLSVISLFCIYNIFINGVSQQKSAFKFDGLGNSVGVFIFTFEGIGLYFDIRYSMKEPYRFKQVLEYTINFTILLYSLIALLGYITFGDNVQDVILFNLPINGFFFNFVQLCYCVALIFSYPLQIFPLVDVKNQYIYVNENYQENNDLDNINQKKIQYEIKSVFVRVFFTLFIFLSALLLNKVSIFINLIGSVCGTTLSYAIPVIICNKCNKNLSKEQYYINCLILIIGIGFGFFGIKSTIQAFYI
ncbi:transmembrane amino acid transporter protein, putative [Ichthyophthirius multifiliis]|uniref:Transmembrane amino acid transporter protein, putative n=1 Tax=Ichthyophthirius multifiliis TaxID=5932 RepID=G0R3F9_ICHMU|nr:transmembrane amino acid transporter protein, putative [Ichthyophthirius multifiliis]EGR27997.1 transmembrane amino acid transporter protein, putative [Ichthyophthirius multifiliis]|eukprot:XP_004027342.1 transmembrane amino acid transporter protein, putative [Ichthyophthirius multifiliis]